MYPVFSGRGSQTCSRTCNKERPSQRNRGRGSRGGGGTLIFSHIRRLGPFFGFKILNFNIFWGFQKN